MPEDLRVDQISSQTARVSWIPPANLRPDEAADTLLLRVTFANHSFVDQLQLPGEATNIALDNLIPAHEYIVVLSAVNSDGEVTTNPVPFTTSTGFPTISHLQVNRVNRTSFVLTVQLAYTGGGAITALEVAYRPTAEPRLETEVMVEYELLSPLSLRGVVTLTDQRQQQEAAMGLTFKVWVRNQFDFRSPDTAVNGESEPCVPVIVYPWEYCTLQCQPIALLQPRQHQTPQELPPLLIPWRQVGSNVQVCVPEITLVNFDQSCFPCG